MNDNNQPNIGDRVYIVSRFADANGAHQVRILKGKIESVILRAKDCVRANSRMYNYFAEADNLPPDSPAKIYYKILFDNINKTDGDADIISADRIFDDYNAALKFAEELLKGKPL